MNDDKLYTYWFIYLKPEYTTEWFDYPGLSYNRYTMDNDCLLIGVFAYATNKEALDEFFKIHDINKFIVDKRKITRDEVNLLASNAQMRKIDKFKITTKDSDGQCVILDMYLSEEEYVSSEHRCYIEIDSLWKYVWDRPDLLKSKYQKALHILNFYRLNNKLQNGETYTEAFIPDILNAFINIYGRLLVS